MVFFYILFNIIKEAILRGRIPAELEVKVCEENETWNASWPGLVMLQFDILIPYVAGPNFLFRCEERGEWCLGWRSVV